LARALTAFQRRHTAEAHSLFDETLLVGPAAQHLALFFTRHLTPRPEDLARIWIDGVGISEWREVDLTPVCRDFLQDLESELKREPELQEVFDRRARESLERSAFSTAYFSATDWYSGEIAGLEEKLLWPWVGRDDVIRVVLESLSWPRGPACLIEGLPGYGKTALMFQLRLQARRSATRGRGQADDNRMASVVSFFVRAEGHRHTVDHFLTAVNSQLARLLGEPETRSIDVEERYRTFLDLWHRAADAATPARPLLLLVDGMDEMDATSGRTIAHVLPSYLPQSVGLVVTSRPNPDLTLQVHREHPLARPSIRLSLPPLTLADLKQLLVELHVRDKVASALAPRVHSKTGGEPMLARLVAEDIAGHGPSALPTAEARPPAGAYDYIVRQLRALAPRIDSAGGAGWEILILLSVARGSLSLEEMSKLVGQPLPAVVVVVNVLKRFLAGRERLSFAHSLFYDVLRGRRIPEVDTSEVAIPAADRSRWEGRLLSWCRQYVDDGFPDDTPAYVLENAASHFAEADDPRLYALVCPRWYELKSTRIRLLTSFAQDVATAAAAATRRDPPDLAGHLGCAMALAALSRAAASVGLDVLSVMVGVGQVERALGYAAVIKDAYERSLAYSAIARHDSTSRDVARELAYRASREISDEAQRGDALLQLIVALEDSSAAHLLVPELLLDTRRCAVPESRARLLVELGIWMSQRQDEQATAVLDEAVEAMRQVTDWWQYSPTAAGHARSLLRAGLHEHARLVIEEVESLMSRIFLLTELARSVTDTGARAHLVEEAASYLPQLEEATYPEQDVLAPLSVASLLDSAARAQALMEHALARARVIYARTPEEGARALTWVAIALAEAGAVDQAVAAARSVEEPALQSEALRSVAVALADDHGTTVALLYEALRVGRAAEQPADRSRLLLAIGAAVSDRSEAAALLAEALDAARECEMSSRRCEALCEVASALGDGVEAAGILEEALLAARAITDPATRAVGLGRIARAANDGRLVSTVVEEWIEAAIQCTPRVDFRGFEYSRDRDRILRGTAAAVAQAGLHDHALRICQQIDDVSDRSSALVQVATSHKQSDVAASLLEQALTVVESGENSRLGNIMAEIAEGLARIGSVERALAVARGLEDSGDRRAALRGVAAAIGDDRQAREVFLEALSVTPKYGSYELVDVVRTMAERHFVSEALEAARGLDDSQAQSMALVAVATQLADSPRCASVIGEAVAAARRIDYQANRESTLGKVALAAASTGHLEQALDCARQCRFDTWRCAALFQTASALRDEVAAAEVLREAKELASTLPGDPPPDEMIAAVQLLVDRGRLEEAMRIVQMLDFDISRGDSLIVIADSLGDHPRTPEIVRWALEVAAEITERGTRDSVLTALAAAAARAGSVDDALGLAGQVSDWHARRTALASTAAAAATYPVFSRVLDHALADTGAVYSVFGGGCRFLAAQYGSDAIGRTIDRLVEVERLAEPGRMVEQSFA
jgi:tetratricopeptide (TPR) repeat protein